jgi:transcriptional regulator with XRE-family HTH domain
LDAIAVGDKLRKMRGSKLQSEVAAALGISTSAVTMYETGERVPRDEIKEKFAKYYGTTVGALFFNEKVHSSWPSALDTERSGGDGQ